MQGPFSSQMNAVMLRATGAKYLVTKEEGAPGGFAERVTVTEETSVTLVVVCRPLQREDLPLSDMVGLLCRRFGLTWRPRVTEVRDRPRPQRIDDPGGLVGYSGCGLSHWCGQVYAAGGREDSLELLRKNRCRFGA